VGSLRNQAVDDSSKSGSSLGQIKLLAWQLADSHQIQTAITLFREFLEESNSVESHLEFAKLLSVFESPSIAVEHLDESVALFSHSSSAKELCLAYNEIASLYRQVGKNSLARRAQQQAIRHDLSRPGSDGLLPESLLGQASDLVILQELESAKYLLLSLLKQTNEISALSRLKLAEIYLIEGESAAAKLMLDEVIEICKVEGHIRLLVQALRLLSQASQMNCEFKIAMKYSIEALDTAKNSARCENEISSLQEDARKLRMKMRVLCQTPEWN